MFSYAALGALSLSGVTNWDDIRKEGTGVLNQCLVRHTQGGAIIIQSGLLFLGLSKSIFPLVKTDRRNPKSLSQIERLSACSSGKVFQNLRMLSMDIKKVPIVFVLIV